MLTRLATGAAWTVLGLLTAIAVLVIVSCWTNKGR
jgi:hypothetical protein